MRVEILQTLDENKARKEKLQHIAGIWELGKLAMDLF